jgi:hypothetical protein
MKELLHVLGYLMDHLEEIAALLCFVFFSFLCGLGVYHYMQLCSFAGVLMMTCLCVGLAAMAGVVYRDLVEFYEPLATEQARVQLEHERRQEAITALQSR